MKKIMGQGGEVEELTYGVCFVFYELWYQETQSLQILFTYL